jgi:tetratricopeptide (TPR) repeat protein
VASQGSRLSRALLLQFTLLQHAGKLQVNYALVAGSLISGDRRRKVLMLYGFPFDDGVYAGQNPVLESSRVHAWPRRSLSDRRRLLTPLRLGMIVLCCCRTMLSWPEETCTLPSDINAAAQQTQAEADAQGISFLQKKSARCALASFTREIRISPEAWQGHYHAGLAYLDLSDGKDAASELQIAADKAPARADVRLALGIAHEALEEYGQAESIYRTAYALDPKSSEIIRHLATVLGEEKQTSAAITYWREAVALAPYDLELRLSLATAFMDDGQDDAAASALKEIVRQNPKFGLALLNLGAVLYRQGRFTDSAGVYSSALQIDTVSDAARLSLSKVLSTLVRYDQAKLLLETYLRAHPDSMEAHYLLGTAYLGLGALGPSAVELQEAVQLNEADYDSQYKLGTVLRESGKYEEAISHLKRAAALRPISREVHFQLFRAYYQSNQRELADQENKVFARLQQADVDQRRATVLENEGAQAVRDGDLPKALAAYGEALKLTPRDGKICYDMALVFERLNDRQSERALLLHAAELNPSLAAVSNQLGYLDLTNGNTAAAEEHFQAALRADPGMADALGNLGVLYGQQGKFASAEHLLRLAVESNSGYEKGFMNLGLILAAEGRLNEARTQMRRALALSSTDAVALQAMRAIEARLENPAKP